MTDIERSNNIWIGRFFIMWPQVVLPDDYHLELYHLDRHHDFHRIKNMDKKYLENILQWFSDTESSPHLDLIHSLLKKKPLTFKRLLEASQK